MAKHSEAQPRTAIDIGCLLTLASTLSSSSAGVRFLANGKLAIATRDRQEIMMLMHEAAPPYNLVEMISGLGDPYFRHGSCCDAGIGYSCCLCHPS